jgi:iron complex outermembrane receptor protein
MQCDGQLLISVLIVCAAVESARAADPQVPAAGGASDDAVLAEIVVTAQKRMENLQDVPIAVSALSAEQLQAYGVSDIDHLTAAVPGLAVDNIGGDYFMPRLRGVGTSSNGPGVENPVALYVDGVYYASQITAPRDLFDVDQISVLKGPQGTLFGRNATGGVIQMNTRDPKQEFAGALQTSYDDYQTSKTDAYVGGGVASDLSANLWLHYTTQGKGWGTNEFNGEDVFRTKREFATRSKWIWAPSADTTVKLNMDFGNSADSMGGNRPFPGTTPLLPGFKTSSNLWDIDSFVTPSSISRNGGGSIQLDQSLGFAHLVSISAYRTWNLINTFSPTLTPIPSQSLTIRQQGDQASEELQLVSDSAAKISWATGVYYLYYNEGTGPTPGFQIDLDGPLAPTPTSLHQIDVHTRVLTNSVAGFGQATAEVATDTKLTLGLRYTSETRDFIGYETGYLNNGFSLGELPIPPIPPELKFTKFTYRVALDHKFNDDILGYVSYNTGFKSGGYNGLDPTNPPYKPEELDATEVGLKTEWLDHRVRLNAAAYHYKYTNVQVSRYTNTAVIYNGAGAKVDGVELDGQALLTREFELTSAVAFMHSKFTSFPDAQFSTPLPTGGAVLYSGDATGNRLPFSPDFTINIAATYHVFSAAGRIDLMLSDYYSDRYFMESDNFVSQPSYDYLNAAVTWNSPDERYKISLWANNLTDRAVANAGATLTSGYILSTGNPPRTVGITAGCKF